MKAVKNAYAARDRPESGWACLQAVNQVPARKAPAQPCRRRQLGCCTGWPARPLKNTVLLPDHR